MSSGDTDRLFQFAGQPPLTIAVTGATGMIGGALASFLTGVGHTVRRVTRTPRAPGDVGWHPGAGVLDAKALDGVDAVVHLAGASVADRWNDERKAEIRHGAKPGKRRTEKREL